MALRKATANKIEGEPVSPDHWLCKMDGYIVWRVIGPRINNPYEIAFPDRVLVAMAQNRELVRAQLKVRCLTDGHEVLVVDNLSLPILTTDHPCLDGITRKQVIGFLEYFGVDKEIEKTIDRIQEEVREELHKREVQSQSMRKTQKTIGQIRAEREAEKRKKQEEAAANNQIRIIRR